MDILLQGESYTALQIAKKQGHSLVVEKLKNAGAF
jgi:hypothetical protein